MGEDGSLSLETKTEISFSVTAKDIRHGLSPEEEMIAIVFRFSGIAVEEELSYSRMDGVVETEILAIWVLVTTLAEEVCSPFTSLEERIVFITNQSPLAVAVFLVLDEILLAIDKVLCIRLGRLHASFVVLIVLAVTVTIIEGGKMAERNERAVDRRFLRRLVGRVTLVIFRKAATFLVKGVGFLVSALITVSFIIGNRGGP